MSNPPSDWNQRIYQAINNISQTVMDTARHEVNEMRETIFTPPVREMSQVSREIPLIPNRNRSTTTDGHNFGEVRSPMSFSGEGQLNFMAQLEQQMEHYHEFISQLNPNNHNNTRLNPLPESARQHIQAYEGEPLKCYLSTREKTNCPICLDPIQPGLMEVSVLPCRHMFHTECIDPWFSTNRECPTCRISPSDIPSNTELPSISTSNQEPVVELKPIRIRRRHGGQTETFQVDFQRPVSELVEKIGSDSSVLILFNQRLESEQSLAEAGVKPNDLLVEWVTN